MAFLISCWFLIEYVLIPNGFHKWFCLSFFINPFFLIFCQIYLWLKVLQSWTSFLFIQLIQPIKFVWFAVLCVFRFLRFHIHRLFPVETSTNCDVFEEVTNSEIVVSSNAIQSIVLYNCYRIPKIESETWLEDHIRHVVYEEELAAYDDNYTKGSTFLEDDDIEESTSHDYEDDVEESTNLHEDGREELTFHEHDLEGTTLHEDSNIVIDVGEASPLPCNPGSTFLEDDDIEESTSHDYEDDVEESTNLHEDGREELTFHEHDLEGTTLHEDSNIVMDVGESSPLPCNPEPPMEDKTDPFYAKYEERMRWFDLLNYERTCGISSMLSKQLGTPSSLESIEDQLMDFSSPYMNLSKMCKRKLIRSLESDIELVYVGQTCLCWEALHHQYRKVEADQLECPCYQKGALYDEVVGNFQKFQVLLERFMENERIEGKRFWNYVQGRFSLKSLLQVPNISGYFEEEKEGSTKGENLKGREVLIRAIEKSIKAFWVFLQTDINRMSWWKFKSLLWTHPPVEDPKDLQLLSDLTQELKKKELKLKDVQMKKRCWLKRAYFQLEEIQRREIFFCMIDMKLVSRVLKMSLISTPQLKWCQHKLNNIDFKEGAVMRATTANLLFPP